MTQPFWVTIERQQNPTPLNLGVGITATSEVDARQLFTEAFGTDLVIKDVTPVQNMNDLDQGHVIPNMGNWFRRGIWFPKGYD
jgi:hypothetical protein